MLTQGEIGEIVGGCKEWFEIPSKVAKAQQTLTRQEIPEAVRAERERIMKIFESFGKVQLKKALSDKEFEALFD